MYQIETPPPGDARRQPDYARLSRHIRVSSGLSCALEQPSQELRRKERKPTAEHDAADLDPGLEGR
jgi:hypothetical protein